MICCNCQIQAIPNPNKWRCSCTKITTINNIRCPEGCDVVDLGDLNVKCDCGHDLLDPYRLIYCG
jgi:hypothetical protein